MNLPWSTVQAIYRAKDGEVVEGKYVRVTGNYDVTVDPSQASGDRVSITPIYRVIFRNLDDGVLYFAGRVMFFDKAQSTENEAVFQHPFVQTPTSPDMSPVNLVQETKHLAGTYFFGSVPN